MLFTAKSLPNFVLESDFICILMGSSVNTVGSGVECSILWGLGLSLVNLPGRRTV